MYKTAHFLTSPSLCPVQLGLATGLSDLWEKFIITKETFAPYCTSKKTLNLNAGRKC